MNSAGSAKDALLHGAMDAAAFKYWGGPKTGTF